MILRELLVKLGLDVDKAAWQEGRIVAGIVEAGLKKLADTALEVAHAFVENTKEAIEYGDKIKKTSQSIGIGIEALQEFQFAGALADLSAEEMSQSIGILSRKMLEAKNGGEEAAKAFKGIGFQEGGKLKPTEEVLGAIADQFAKMEDGPEKTARAMQLFGRAGKQMIPLLNKGSSALEEMRQEARDLGLVMGKDAVNAAEELNDDLHRLHLVTAGIWRQAIAPLIPDLAHLVKSFLEWRKANAAIIAQKIQVVIKAVASAIHFLHRAMEFVIDNFTAFKILIGTAGLFMAVNYLATAFTALSWAGVKAAMSIARAWLIAAAPFIAIGAIVAGFLLVFDDIRGYLAGEDSLYGTFKQEIDDWTKQKSDIWFVQALKDFIAYLQEAIEWMKDLDEVFGDGSKARALADRRAGLNKGQLQMQTDRIQLETARTQARAGVPLTDASKAALKRSGVTEEAFTQKYGPAAGTGAATPTVPVPSVPTPEVRAPAGSGAPSGPVTNTTQVGPIIQREGEDSEGFAQRVAQIAGNIFQGHLEAALPAVKR